MRDFNENEFDVFDLEQSIEQEFEPTDPLEDPNSNRWGLMFLKDLPLYKHIGNNVLVDLNVYDKSRRLVHNRDYFPKNNLMMLKNITAPTPAEGVASVVNSNSSEAHARPFDANSAETGVMNRQITKTAAQCAAYFISTYGKLGGVIFNSLTGVENYKEARQLFYTVLPLNDPEIFPETTKIILGEEFKSPFLFEILRFLQSSEPRQRISDARVDMAVKDRLKELLNELLTGARTANGIAKAQIADTESQISATPQRKTGYDIRDTTFKNSPEPWDLVCLAHRNQLPKDERALENARQLQETGNEPVKQMTANVNKLVEMQMLQQQQNSSPMNGMSAEDIAKLVASEVEKGIKAAQLTAKPAEEVKNSDTAGATGSDSPGGDAGKESAKGAKKAS